jgi:hypothetical protein
LAPFGTIAALLSELLPISGTQHASTVHNRTRRVGETVIWQQNSANTAKPVGPVVIGLDGGYVRNRHGGEGRHFEGTASVRLWPFIGGDGGALIGWRSGWM